MAATDSRPNKRSDEGAATVPTRVDRETLNCRECQGALSCMHCHPEDRPTQTLRIAELEAALRAIASRDIPHPGQDWAEVEFAAKVCDRLGIAYETKWDQ